MNQQRFFKNGIDIIYKYVQENKAKYKEPGWKRTESKTPTDADSL